MRRISFSVNEYYHCYNRGVEKRKIFLSDKDYLRFTVLLYLCNTSKPIHLINKNFKNLSELFNLDNFDSLVSIGAWVLMPNHFHILLKEKREDGISLFMQKLATAYTMYFNKKNERTGSLFGGTFKAEHLDKDTYLKYIFSYIHLNPLKLIDSKWKESGLENFNQANSFLVNYKWSSYLDYKGYTRAQNKILDREAFPIYFQNIADWDKEMCEWLIFPDSEV